MRYFLKEKKAIFQISKVEGGTGLLFIYMFIWGCGFVLLRGFGGRGLSLGLETQACA